MGMQNVCRWENSIKEIGLRYAMDSFGSGYGLVLGLYGFSSDPSSCAKRFEFLEQLDDYQFLEKDTSLRSDVTVDKYKGKFMPGLN